MTGVISEMNLFHERIGLNYSYYFFNMMELFTQHRCENFLTKITAI